MHPFCCQKIAKAVRTVYEPIELGFHTEYDFCRAYSSPLSSFALSREDSFLRTLRQDETEPNALRPTPFLIPVGTKIEDMCCDPEYQPTSP